MTTDGMVMTLISDNKRNMDINQYHLSSSLRAVINQHIHTGAN